MSLYRSIDCSIVFSYRCSGPRAPPSLDGFVCIRYNSITFQICFIFPKESASGSKRQVVPLNINTQQMRYFMELAKCLNFTRAAANLYVAQPTLSQQIAELESQLGVTLFTRSSRAVTLTPAGKILQEAYPELMTRMEQVQQHMLITAAGFSGSLTIGFLDCFLDLLPAVIRYFKAEFPDIIIKPVSVNPKKLLDGLKNQTLDVVLTQIQQLPPEMTNRYESRFIMRDPLYFVLPADLPAPADFSFAASLPLITFSEDCVPGYHAHVMECLQTLELQPPGVIHVNSPREIQVYLGAGQGFSVLSARPAGLISSPVQLIPIPGEYRDFGILWDPSSTNPALPLLLDTMEQYTGSDPALT